jgi:hypothetical protein
MKLTTDEKKYLWSKLEYSKKKKATETKNDLFEILNGDKEEITEDEFKKVLSSLEFTFRVRLKDAEKPLNNEHFKSIQAKLPESWINVKYSRKKNEHVKDFDDFSNSVNS